jgi:hypothetical protein
MVSNFWNLQLKQQACKIFKGIICTVSLLSMADDVKGEEVNRYNDNIGGEEIGRYNNNINGEEEENCRYDNTKEEYDCFYYAARDGLLGLISNFRIEYMYWGFDKWKNDGKRFMTDEFATSYINTGMPPELKDGRPELDEWFKHTLESAIFVLHWSDGARDQWARSFFNTMKEFYLAKGSIPDSLLTYLNESIRCSSYSYDHFYV